MLCCCCLGFLKEVLLQSEKMEHSDDVLLLFARINPTQRMDEPSNFEKQEQENSRSGHVALVYLLK